eukprot:6621528-Prymnesium_polylepis.1
MDAASRTTMLDTRPVSLDDQFPNDTNASCFLRSVEGGVQGCGATNFTVGPYHEQCNVSIRTWTLRVMRMTPTWKRPSPLKG